MKHEWGTKRFPANCVGEGSGSAIAKSQPFLVSHLGWPRRPLQGGAPRCTHVAVLWSVVLPPTKTGPQIKLEDGWGDLRDFMP
eukprot:293677-Amphidinium_carterae.2